MSFNFNSKAKVTIVGQIAREPEMRYSPSGKAVTSFSVPVEHSWVGGDGERQKFTQWFNCTLWGTDAENANKYAQKGTKVLIEGRLECDRATGGPKIFTKQDGSQSSKNEITVSEITLIF